MAKMGLDALLLVCGFITATVGEQRITVSLLECTEMVNIDTEKTVTLLYEGSSIRSCQFLVYTEQSNVDLCVSPERADLGCSVKVLYAGGTFYPGSPDKEYTCTSQPEKWCTSRGMLYVTFVQNGTEIKSNVQLNIYSEKGSGEAKSNKAVVMGVAIGCSVFVIACLAIVGYCCFIRRCSHKFNRKRHKPKAVPREDFPL